MKLSLVSAEYMIDTTVTGTGRVRRTPTIHLFCRKEDGDRQPVRLVAFRPYFYIKKEELVLATEALMKYNLDYMLRDRQEGFKDMYGEELIKVFTKLPNEVGMMRDILHRKGLSTWEADILFPIRYLVDSGIKSGLDYDPVSGIFKPIDFEMPLRIWMVDIEVYSEEKRVPDPKKARKPIIAISIWDSYDDSYVVLYVDTGKEVSFTYEDWEDDVKEYISKRVILMKCPDEKTLLQQFLSQVKAKQPDVVSGWNLVGFDFPFIIGRMRRNRVPYKQLSELKYVRIRRERDIQVKGMVILDLADGYQILSLRELEQWGSAALELVAQRELVEKGKLKFGKLKLNMPLHEAWKTDPSKLLEYNLRDTYLTYRLDKELGIIGFFDSLRRMAGANLLDAFRRSRIADILILRYCHGNVCLPSKRKTDYYAAKAAVVLPPSPGIHENVCLLDLKESYPSVIRGLNISPETFSPGFGDIKVDDTHYFMKTPKGIIPAVLEGILAKRAEEINLRDEAFNQNRMDLVDVKEKKSTVLKYQANALAGILAYAEFRLFSPNVFESITKVARECLMHVAKTVGEFWKVIYGDTDSTFFELGPGDKDALISLGKAAEEKANAALPEFAMKYGITENHPFKASLKKIYTRFIMFPKKGGKEGAKKRYAGLILWSDKEKEGDIEFKGLQTIRSDVSTLGKGVQRKWLEMLLKQVPLESRLLYLHGIIEKVRSGGADIVDLGIPSKITKPVRAYTAFCMHGGNVVNGVKVPKYQVPMTLNMEFLVFRCKCGKVRKPSANLQGILYSNKYFGTEFGEGSKPKRIYVKAMPLGYPRTDIIAFDDYTPLPEGIVFDYEKMLELDVHQKLEEILALEGLKWGRIANKTMEDFF